MQGERKLVKSAESCRFPVSLSEIKIGKSYSERKTFDKTCPFAEFSKSVAVKFILSSAVKVWNASKELPKHI